MNNYDVAQYILESGGTLWGGYVRDFIAGVKPKGDIDVYISDYHNFNPDKFAKILLDKGISCQKIEQTVKEESKTEQPAVAPRASYSNFLNEIDHLEPPLMTAQSVLDKKKLLRLRGELVEFMRDGDYSVPQCIGYSGIPAPKASWASRDSNEDFLFWESARYKKISKSGDFQRFLVGDEQIQVDFCYAPIIELDFTVHALTMFLDNGEELVFGTLDGYEQKGNILTLMKHIRDRVLIPASGPMSSVPQFRIDKMVSKGYRLL